VILKSSHFGGQIFLTAYQPLLNSGMKFRIITSRRSSSITAITMAQVLSRVLWGQLKVSALKGAGSVFTLIVESGAAIDAAGRALFLYEPQALTLDCKKYKLPSTVFVVIKYNEVLEDYFQNQDNTDFQGYKKKTESAKVEITQQFDPTENVIELVRIHLKEDSKGDIKEIRQAESFSDPGDNSLDFRYLHWSSAAKKGLSPYLQEFLVKLLEQTRTVAMISHDAVHLQGLRELQTISLTAKMLVQCGDVSFNDIVNIVYPLYDLNNQILQEILEYEREENARSFSLKDTFGDMQTAVYEMGDIIKYFDYSYEHLDSLLKTHRRVIEGLRTLFITKQMTAQDLALMSKELPRVLMLGAERFTLVDFIDLRDQESVEAHKLDFHNSKDVSTANLVHTYPDGATVRDAVKSFVGGAAVFQLKNVIRHRKLLIIRRTDVVNGNYSVDVKLSENYSKKLLVDARTLKPMAESIGSV
jgi:hypothetical protein